MKPRVLPGILPAEQSEESTAGKMPAAPSWRRLTCQRFTTPMRKKTKGDLHVPPMDPVRRLPTSAFQLSFFRLASCRDLDGTDDDDGQTGQGCRACAGQTDHGGKE